MVQTYQARAEMRINQLQFEADSEHITPIMDKLFEAGWPGNIEAFETFSTLDQRRVRAWLTAQQRQLDNYHFQYEHGLVEPENWSSVIVPAIRLLAPGWREVQAPYRTGFKSAVERILADQEPE